MPEVKNSLANRNEKLCAIPGTRLFQSTPLSACILAMKRLSKADADDLIFELYKKTSCGLV